MKAGPLIALACASAFCAPVSALAQNGRDDPLPLRFEAAPCDETASLLAVPRPLARYLKEVPGDGGLIALLDFGGPEPWRYHILVADRIGLKREDPSTVHCQIVTLAEPGLALTRDFQFGSVGRTGNRGDEERHGPAATLSLKLLRTDMTGGRFRSDAVGFIQFDHDTGEVSLELWSIAEPRRVLR